MTEKQKECLMLVTLEGYTYQNAAEKLGITYKDVSECYAAFPEFRQHLSAARKLWMTKLEKEEGHSVSVRDFYERYQQIEKKCCYCGINEEELVEIYNQPGFVAKSGRGLHLELERVEHEQPYHNLANLALACYWCNNAKTDTFKANEFAPIGLEIRKVWENRLKRPLK